MDVSFCKVWNALLKMYHILFSSKNFYINSLHIKQKWCFLLAGRWRGSTTPASVKHTRTHTRPQKYDRFCFQPWPSLEEHVPMQITKWPPFIKPFWERKRRKWWDICLNLRSQQAFWCARKCPGVGWQTMWAPRCVFSNVFVVFLSVFRHLGDIFHPNWIMCKTYNFGARCFAGLHSQLCFYAKYGKHTEGWN